MHMIQEEFLTKRDLQNLLKISRATVDRMMKDVPYIKLGKKVLFRKSDIEAYLKSKTVKR